MTDTDTPGTPDAMPGSDDDTRADAPLNREQRRAQARGKKSGGAAATNSSTAGNANPRVSGGRGPGAGGQVRYPRTGHK